MKLKKIKINKNTITGSTLSLNLLLNSKTVGLDFYTDLSSNLTISAQTTPVNLTGYTDNKLNLVRSYDYNNPYVVGVNGVTEVDINYIKYIINGINYITNVNDLTTTFEFSTLRYYYTNSNYIGEEDLINYVDKTQIDNEISIERQQTSVIENFSKLRQVSSTEDFTTFSNSFYTINNQTV